MAIHFNKMITIKPQYSACWHNDATLRCSGFLRSE